MHAAVHESTGYTPFELVYSYNVRTPIDMLKERLSGPEVDAEMPLHEYVARLRRLMSCLAKRAVENENKIKIARKERYDKSATMESYKEGDHVFVMRPFKAHSLEPNWI